MSAPLSIGLDLGGTKIEARVLRGDGVEPVPPIRIATPREDYAATVTALRDLTARAAQAVGVATLPVAVAIPGAICPMREVVKNANSTWLNGQALHRDLAAAFGREVRVENDANCFVLSEARDGAASGANSVFGIILGTGVGGGFVVDGKVLTGANRIGGEWGHNPILPGCAPDQRACYCGARDCVEAHLSGPALEAAYRAAGGASLRATEMAERVVDDPIARQVFGRWLETLTASLAHVVNILDPEVIVLGGGLSNITDLPAQLTATLPARVFGTTGADLKTRILRNQHGDSSGARGAAWLAQ